MSFRCSIRARVVALVVVPALLAACGDGDPGAENGPKPQANATGQDNAASKKTDFDTVFRAEQQLRLALPEPTDMRGWESHGTSAVVDQRPGDSSQCRTASWDCAAIGRGAAEFEGPDDGEEATFELQAFADRKAAQDACNREAAWSAEYGRATMSPVSVPTSHAYYRTVGGLNGIHLVMCMGTVVATVSLAGGSMDSSTTHVLGEVFATSIRKAAALSQ